MNNRNCPHCNCSIGVIRFSTTSKGKQRFKCKRCNIMWILKSHPQVLAKHIWDDLVFRSMNYSELADKYEVSERNVRRKLDLYTPPEIIPTPADVIAMDVTYFGRSWGILTVIMFIMENLSTVKRQTAMKQFGTTRKQSGSCINITCILKSAIADGKTGVIKILEEYGIKVQFCQFHQLKIVT